MNFTVREIELPVEALERAASRHESMARFNPRSAKSHDNKAAGMRALRLRVLRQRMVVLESERSKLGRR